MSSSQSPPALEAGPDRLTLYLNVSVRDLIVMQVLQTLQDLLGVEADGGLVVLQGSPLGAQKG